MGRAFGEGICKITHIYSSSLEMNGTSLQCKVSSMVIYSLFKSKDHLPEFWGWDRARHPTTLGWKLVWGGWWCGRIYHPSRDSKSSGATGIQNTHYKCSSKKRQAIVTPVPIMSVPGQQSAARAPCARSDISVCGKFGIIRLRRKSRRSMPSTPAAHSDAAR